MPHYRAYLEGSDGHFLKVNDLDCSDDEAAIEAAKQLVNEYNVELWQRNRRIGRFSKPK